MADYETLRSEVIRARTTEKRVRACDALDLVAEIHRLEDDRSVLLAALRKVDRLWRMCRFDDGSAFDAAHHEVGAAIARAEGRPC